MIDQHTILSNLGYEALTPMQQAMGQAATHQGGVVLLSPTGTGKTLAYLLPLLKLVKENYTALQAVIIVPTRELAAQSEQMLRQMRTGIKALSLYGGRPAMQEHRVIREVKPQVVFATPGRLNDHLDKENIQTQGVRLLVIDEFDKCLELGFQSEMESAVRHFSALEHCWLLSATDAESIPAFMNRIVAHFDKLNYLVANDNEPARTTIWQVKSADKDKLNTLGQLLTYLKDEATIVFVAHRESVERVGNWLKAQGFAATMYHGGMEQDVRERALYKFRNGSATTLVSTDLAARGLDIPEVRAVVHYHLPLKAEEFTHRNGRTARWEANGAVYLIIGPTEQLPIFAHEAQELHLPQATISPAMPRYTSLYIGRGKSDKLSKADVLGFLCKKGGLRATDIGRIDVTAHAAYVAVARGQVKAMLRKVAGEKIKGMKTLIEEMRQ